MVRGDYGTENASVAKIHLAFRMNNTSDVTKDFLYGPSTANTVSCSHYWQKNQTSHPSCSLNPRPFVLLFTPSLEEWRAWFAVTKIEAQLLDLMTCACGPTDQTHTNHNASDGHGQSPQTNRIVYSAIRHFVSPIPRELSRGSLLYDGLKWIGGSNCAR